MDVQQQFRSAVDHCRRGELARGEQICRAIVAEQPTQPDALHLLGMIAMQTGRPGEAAEWFSKAVAERPIAEYYLNLGNALKAVGIHDQAVTAFEAVLRIDPNHVAALNNLGGSLHTMGKLPEAEAKVRRALEIKPNLPQALFNLGKILADMNRLEEAAELFRRAIAIDPRAPVLHHGLGHVLGRQGRYAEAAKAYRHAVALNPNWPEAYNDLCTALRDAGDFDGAIAAARESLRLRPGFDLARKNLAGALNSKGDIDQAIDIYAQLVSERPTDDEALKIYGNFSMSAGPRRRWPTFIALPKFAPRISGRPAITCSHCNSTVTIRWCYWRSIASGMHDTPPR
jgi:tetratricopeptide (TPR) repeat protein